jgi:membrane protein DedA with SNARE-associated domain
MFEWIIRVIERLGYAGIALLTFLENVFPPVPSEIVIPLAGFVSARGAFDLWLVIIVASIGSLAGATVWYLAGRRIGEKRLRAWVERHGRWLTLSTHDVDRAQAWFQRHGGAAVFIGRLIPGVRTFVSLPAGFSAMPVVPFLAYSAVGTALWTAALAYAGVILQANFTRVSQYVDVVANLLFGAMAVMLVRRYVRCWRYRRANNH